MFVCVGLWETNFRKGRLFQDLHEQALRHSLRRGGQALVQDEEIALLNGDRNRRVQKRGEINTGRRGSMITCKTGESTQKFLAVGKHSAEGFHHKGDKLGQLELSILAMLGDFQFRRASGSLQLDDVRFGLFDGRGARGVDDLNVHKDVLVAQDGLDVRSAVVPVQVLVVEVSGFQSMDSAGYLDKG